MTGGAIMPRVTWRSGILGGGLGLAALTDTCAPGTALDGMSWKRRTARPAGCAPDRLTKQG